ncbi:MAG: class I SAM-dependent methyltransferase [Acidimicrobiia bacterium]
MDRWDGGSDYDVFMGRWSRAVASDFVGRLAVGRGLRWLDVGCGTGALTEAIVSATEPAAVAGVDPSPYFIAEARQRFDGRVDLQVADGGDLPFPDGVFDVVVSGLALNFIPDPVRALREWKRVAEPGGLVGVYVWDYTEGMEFLRIFWDAVVEVDESARDLDEGRRFPICRSDELFNTFSDAGLSNITSSSIEIATCFGSFDDYWNPFLSGQGPAPTYVAGLSQGDREDLRQRLRTKLAPDGAIDLTARAWVAAGST